ncbi:MAG: ABC-three component system protein [Cetobacterium sp.]|uniref:ABC-three component system protein n=1 Tax=Cetobacterium sp. TaxID=2071632 RepID=UPI003EE58C95
MEKGIIIFVHGILGDDKTWFNQKKFFKDLLLQDEDIEKRYDCVHYNYDSDYFYIESVHNIKNVMKTIALKFNLQKKTKNNLTISDIADLLKSDIEYRYEKYSEIIIIAHSMGGLISKKYILENLKNHKVKLYFSLATPYQGSKKSDLIPCRSGFVENLQPVSQAVTEIAKKWIKASKDSLPKTFYILGKHDWLVNKESGFSFESPLREEGIDYKILTTDDDHTTISKPQDNSTVLLMVKKEIQNHIKVNQIVEPENLLTDEEYNEMTFVVKMMIANVLKPTIESSKLSYIHFEALYRKLSKSEIDKLKLLAVKIKQLYLTKYTEFELNKIPNSTELVLEIKNELAEKDHDYYTFENKILEHLHKFGLLHSLADRDESIIWTKGV